MARRNPLERQAMLVERWIELASQGGGRFLVLVVDEAQGMTQRVMPCRLCLSVKCQSHFEMSEADIIN
jgi:hypothetical protein